MIETHAVPRRSEVPKEFTWDLTTVYVDDSAWEEDVARLEAMASEIAAVQGTIEQGANALVRALQMNDRVSMLLGRLYAYARLRKDADGTNPVGQALQERAGSLYARFEAALSFVEPEILALPPTTLARWQKEEPALEPYAYYLEQLGRRRAHVRSAEVEAIVAAFGDVLRAPRETQDVLTNVDLSFPTITDAEGQPVQLSNARYGVFLMSTDRRVRRDAFKGLLGTYHTVRTTLATTLGATVRTHALNARLRAYPSSLAAALEPNDIPVEVYHNLIATVGANLPLLHRYVDLRRRVMGLDEVHHYDLYAPLVRQADEAFAYAQATELVRAACAPLGPDYGAVVQEVLASRWIDVYENVGKRSGAYSGGAYGTPPFVLLNYHDRLRDVYTLAHELGHSLHSYFTRQAQPYVSGQYTIFVAEVASTLNEALLTDYLLHTTADEALRRRLVVEQAEEIRTTIFRQTMFAEFELDLHARADRGEALTADELCHRYRDLVARYYGPGFALDDEISVEWAYIPHFYFNFYVYQYATGLAAALALSSQILGDGELAVQRYLRFLRSGSSRPSIDLLRDAGVDMTSRAPIQQAMDRFATLLDQMEGFDLQQDVAPR